MNLSRKWLADFVLVDDVDNKTYADRLTITGSKVEGFEVLDKIASTPTGYQDRPIDDQVIKNITIEE